MIQLLGAHVVMDGGEAQRERYRADEEVIREVALQPNGSFVHPLQLLHGEILRIHVDRGDGHRAWEYIRIDPNNGPVTSIQPVDDDGRPA